MKRLLSVNLALATRIEIDGRTIMSAIRKRPVDGPVPVTPMGLDGDEQADASLHGGLSKALYAYPSEHDPFWQTVRAQARAAGWDEDLPHGAMGENLTIAGLLESQVWIGDLLKFPDCTLAVTKPRVPCFKFNAAMGFDQAAKLMWANGWCGFYLAVREPGTLAPGQAFEVIPGPREVGIGELFRAKAER